MSSSARYAELRRLGIRTITTAQAAAAWKTSVSAASKMLLELSTSGLLERLRHGVWLLEPGATPESLAAEITAPYPSYVSHVSALHLLGVIDQVPAEVHLVSVARPRRLSTSRGAYRLHRVPLELFGGHTTAFRGLTMATMEKAVFDWAYLSVASGHPHARLPETEWPASLRRHEIDRWLRRIESPRLRTLTRELIDRTLGRTFRHRRRTTSRVPGRVRSG